MIYQTLAELKAECDRARDFGRPLPVLVLDNDTISAYQDDDNDSAEELFEMHTALVLEQALDLLGIPHEHA